MLPARTGLILNKIVEAYIGSALPVPSQRIAGDNDLKVSPATIRNEMAFLEQEGYLIRPHTSAGCIPSDRGYRHYVESIGNVQLPIGEQRLISHVFHQVEREVEAWLHLTATLMAKLVQNVAVVSMPKSPDCKLKHLELLSIQDNLALVVIVLFGGKVKQKLITFPETALQSRLTVISQKLNDAYAGMDSRQINASETELSELEKLITEHLMAIMKSEDRQEYEEPYLEGWQFMLNQPEFTRGEGVGNLMELVEQRGLMKAIAPAPLKKKSVHVIIGSENRETAIQGCSIVISEYGMPNEATGAVGVLGPTRMPYSHTISTVDYISSILSELVSGLYGKGESSKQI